MIIRIEVLPIDIITFMHSFSSWAHRYGLSVQRLIDEITDNGYGDEDTIGDAIKNAIVRGDEFVEDYSHYQSMYSSAFLAILGTVSTWKIINASQEKRIRDVFDSLLDRPIDEDSVNKWYLEVFECIKDVFSEFEKECA